MRQDKKKLNVIEKRHLLILNLFKILKKNWQNILKLQNLENYT